jgi:hypothetical protein
MCLQDPFRREGGSVSDERVENKPNCWTCVYCGFHYFHSEIELAEVICNCGIGMGRWKVDYVERLAGEEGTK